MLAYLKTDVTPIVTTLVLISHLLFILFFLLFTLEKNFRNKAYDFVDKYILELIFGISLVAMLGSLAYSNIVGFNPCELCWFQRIVMYPQVILAGMALWKKDKRIASYLFPLSVIGAVIAFFHSLVHWGIGTKLLACTTTGGECAKVFVLKYGYITIPFMAFTAFILLITVSALYFKARNGR